ncbi:MAG: hypothetical protein OEL84_01465 [Nitrosopumilus sp.]|nr:hypothetical protein [Nitrosopumilus sp.]
MTYHFHTSHANHDYLVDHKSHVLKVKDISCEGGACDEKNDHTHDHKKKRKKVSNIYGFNLTTKAS